MVITVSCCTGTVTFCLDFTQAFQLFLCKNNIFFQHRNFLLDNPLLDVEKTFSLWFDLLLNTPSFFGRLFTLRQGCLLIFKTYIAMTSCECWWTWSLEAVILVMKEIRWGKAFDFVCTQKSTLDPFFLSVAHWYHLMMWSVGIVSKVCFKVAQSLLF